MGWAIAASSTLYDCDRVMDFGFDGVLELLFGIYL